MGSLVGVFCWERENGDDALDFLEQRWAFCRRQEVPVDEEGNVSDATLEPCVERGCWTVDCDFYGQPKLLCSIQVPVLFETVHPSVWFAYHQLGLQH